MGDYFNPNALGGSANINKPNFSNQMNQSYMLSSQPVANMQKQSIANQRKRNQKNQQNQQTAANIMGAAAGFGGSMLAGIGDDYDPVTGLKKPSYAKDAGQSMLAGMQAGSAFGPIGGIVGLAIGGGMAAAQAPGKKIAFAEQLAAYNTAKQIQNRNKYLLPDYTSTQIGGIGAEYSSPYSMPIGKFGLKSNQSLAELESNEVVIRKNPNSGNYSIVLETDSSVPKHENGGQVFALNDGDLVFPNKYVKKVKQAIENNDNKTIEKLKQDMLLTSTAAALQGKEFSNTAGIDEQLKEMDKLSLKKLDKKMNNMNMNMNYSRYGSHVGKKKNKMEYGGMTYSKMKQGGMLKQIPAGEKGKGLRKLKEESPETVNKMGYMQAGGMPNNPYMPVMSGPNYAENQAPMNYNQQLYGDIMNPQMMQMGGVMEGDDADMEIGQDNEMNEMDFNFNELVQQMKYGAKMMNGGMAKMMKYGSKMGYGGKSKKQFAYGGMNTMGMGGMNAMMGDPGDPSFKIPIYYGEGTKKQKRNMERVKRAAERNPRIAEYVNLNYPQYATPENTIPTGVMGDIQKFPTDEERMAEQGLKGYNLSLGTQEIAFTPNVNRIDANALPSLRKIRKLSR